MTVALNPYLSFRDTAAQAMALYQSVFGGELTQSTFAESGMVEAGGDGIMHAQLVTPNGMTLMASDTPPSMEYSPGCAHALSLNGDAEDAEVLRGWFAGLSEGGTVTMPLGEAPWGALFGMCTDRYGVNWMVNIPLS